MAKPIEIVWYQLMFAGDWEYPLVEAELQQYGASWQQEFAPAGIELSVRQEDAITLKVNGYADLLNSVRFNSPTDNQYGVTLGRIICTSKDCDFWTDVKRGLRRIAFSPESIPPPSDTMLCHNCGCGC